MRQTADAASHQCHKRELLRQLTNQIDRSSSAVDGACGPHQAARMISQARLLLGRVLAHMGPSCGCSSGLDARLLTVDEVPDVMKEPYIYTGYRLVEKPWGYYLRTLFSCHNETMNVWSHGLGFFLVLYSQLTFLAQAGVDDWHVWPVFILGVSSLIMLALSAIAHLLHSKSRWHHFAFFLLDYMGVTTYGYGSGMASMFVCSSLAFHDAFAKWFMPANVLLTWFAFFACCVAKIKLGHNNSQRKALMLVGVVFQAVFCSLPALSRFYECTMQIHPPNCQVSSLGHLAIVFILLILCGVLFLLHMPESIWPGRFDFLGHGHQLFHLLSLWTMLVQVWAISLDVAMEGAEKRRLWAQPSPAELVGWLFLLVLLEVVTLLYYMRQVVFRRLSTNTSSQPVSETSKNCAMGPQEEQTQTNGVHVSSKEFNRPGVGESNVILRGDINVLNSALAPHKKEESQPRIHVAEYRTAYSDKKCK